MLVIDLVTDALRDLGIISEIATPSAEQGQQGVTKLNDLMASLEVDGIVFGYNPKGTTAESIVIPDGHLAAIKALLGARLCDSYGISPVPEGIANIANAGYNRMLRQAVIGQMRPTQSDSPWGEQQLRWWDYYLG